MKRKDRTAEKRQPIPSGLAGTAPLRRAFGLVFHVVLVAFSLRVLGCGAHQRGALVYAKHTPWCQIAKNTFLSFDYQQEIACYYSHFRI